ncbi:hypothetical protein K501DRAFT_335596 [Backusella circina FSU 941]|nr:hypothetical protein K501DRAFT_335596 [Backusella circina FSU 941]
MLQEDDDEHDDDINDMIYGALSSQQDERLVTEAEEKLSGAQTLFLGSDFGNDESDALIRRIQEEDALDSKYQTFAKTRDDEFESRVHALQKEAPITTATYDDKPAGSIPKPLLKEDLHDEMDDWCTICNEDATIECLGCDNDKYCSHCFYETHRSEMADYDATTHKSKSYTKQF